MNSGFHSSDSDFGANRSFQPCILFTYIVKTLIAQDRHLSNFPLTLQSVSLCFAAGDRIGRNVFLICEFQNLLPVFWLPQYWPDETALPRSQSRRHLLRIRNSETVHPPSNLDYDPDETGSTPSSFFQPSARKILPPLLWLFCFLLSEKYCRCFFGSLYYDCHF